MKVVARAIIAAGLGLGVIVAAAPSASAHPLGNFTINQYSGLRVQPDRVLVDYVVDRAEIPTFQARDDVTAMGQGAWSRSQCADVALAVDLRVDGRAVALRVTRNAMAYLSGTGGLPTLRLTCSLEAGTGGRKNVFDLRYADRYLAGRVGWHEITAVGDGATLLSSDVPRRSISHRLTKYPTDLLQSPPDRRTGHVRARPGGAAARDLRDTAAVRRTNLPLGADRVTAAFTDLVGRQHLTVPFGLLAVGVALLLGAFHALAPGHGKTVMAAYLVGQRGSLRQAWLLGLTVTLTHTAGVLALGLVLSLSSVLAPEHLYPWLAVGSGLLFAAIGAQLLVRALRRRQAVAAARHGHHHDHDEHGHDHDHDEHVHDYDEHVHDHGAGPHRHLPVDDRPLTWRNLVPLGLAGGMVPTPSALVVLLGAIALGRTWFGVVLVLTYGAGMAATLTGAGLLLVRARGVIERRAVRWRGGALARAGALMPLATASVIVVVGLVLAARGVSQV